MATPNGYSHLRHVRALWRHQVWTRWIGGVWAALGVFTFFRDEFLQPTDEQRWKIINMIPHLPLSWWLFGLALIFAVGIFEASFRLSREMYSTIASLTDEKKSVRIELSGLYKDGQSLMSRCLVEQAALSESDAMRWLQEVEEFIGKKLDESYLARFNDTSGASDLRPVGKFSNESIILWQFIRLRVTHLNEFIKELSA
jgi:hypothetical protein